MANSYPDPVNVLPFWGCVLHYYKVYPQKGLGLGFKVCWASPILPPIPSEVRSFEDNEVHSLGFRGYSRGSLRVAGAVVGLG